MRKRLISLLLLCTNHHISHNLIAAVQFSLIPYSVDQNKHTPCSAHMVIHRDGNPVNDRNGTREDPRQCTSCNKYSSNKTELNDGCKNCIDTFSNAIPNANDFARHSGTQSIVKNKPWTTPNVPAACDKVT